MLKRESDEIHLSVFLLRFNESPSEGSIKFRHLQLSMTHMACRSRSDPSLLKVLIQRPAMNGGKIHIHQIPTHTKFLRTAKQHPSQRGAVSTRHTAAILRSLKSSILIINIPYQVQPAKTTTWLTDPLSLKHPLIQINLNTTVQLNQIPLYHPKHQAIVTSPLFPTSYDNPTHPKT